MTSAKPEKRPPEPRDAFRWLLAIATRWMDNGVDGHATTVNYHWLFDTASNRDLSDVDGFDGRADAGIAIAPDSFCRFHRSFANQEPMQAGLRVGRVGTSSVRYEIGLSGAGKATAWANGHFAHVFAERHAPTPVAIPAKLRAALARLVA